MRFFVAMVAAKLAYRILRLLGRSASHYPGWIALKLCPTYLSVVPKCQLTICVTGTNGKTTVTNLISDVLVSNKFSVSTNRIGSNIAPGVATALTNAVSWRGRPVCDACVLEVDERASRLILPAVKPDYLVVTNLFRDSLKRNANPAFMRDLIEAHTPDGTTLVLNADDLCSSTLCADRPNRRVFFGMDQLPGDATTPADNIVTDHTACPVCHAQLVWRVRRYHHIGRAHCPGCGYASHAADYELVAVDGPTIAVRHGEVVVTYPLINDTMFNVYNELTAIATLCEVGLTPQQIGVSLTSLAVVDSRMNETSIGPVRVVMAMSKGQSCVSTSRTLDFVRQEPGRKAVMLVMDDWYDRRHSVEYIGWIYDADFEFLKDETVVQVLACGPRCYDYQLRLLVAGIDQSRITCCEDELAAPRSLKLDNLDAVFILYDTSTIHRAAELKQKTLDELRKVYS